MNNKKDLNINSLAERQAKIISELTANSLDLIHKIEELESEKEKGVKLDNSTPKKEKSYKEIKEEFKVDKEKTLNFLTEKCYSRNGYYDIEEFITNEDIFTLCLLREGLIGYDESTKTYCNHLDKYGELERYSYRGGEGLEFRCCNNKEYSEEEIFRIKELKKFCFNLSREEDNYEYYND